jgi:hypothetical protein
MYAVLALPTVTRICARGADPIGAFGLVGRAVTNRYHITRSPGTTHWLIWFGRRTVYQSLPLSGSGSGPAVRDLYQSLPPRTRTGHGSECSGERGGVGQRGCHRGSRAKGYVGLEWWYSVAQRGEPSTPSEVGHTARSVSKRKKEKNLAMVA